MLCETHISIRITLKFFTQERTYVTINRIKIVTRNSTVDEISERYRLNHAIVVNLTTSIFNFRVTFASLIGEP